jgi:endogenous inhibitor of DNA gyrase (YacG/DUF329 family)
MRVAYSFICPNCGADFRDTHKGRKFCSKACRLETERRTWAERLVVRFWAKVDKSDECWIWTGSRDKDGYGRIQLGVALGCPSHRLAWEFENGPVPEGMLVCHKCDNPPCVRLDHLFLGTAFDNTADMISKGRRRGNRSLTDDQIREVRVLHATMTNRAIARRFGVSNGTIDHIFQGRSWTHIT